MILKGFELTLEKEMKRLNFSSKNKRRGIRE